MRSGSLAKPRPLVAFDCGSQSTSKDLTSAAAKEAARLMAVVVFPTPPFWLATAMTCPMRFLRVGRSALLTLAKDRRMRNAAKWCMFYVEQSRFNVGYFFAR